MKLKPRSFSLNGVHIPHRISGPNPKINSDSILLSFPQEILLEILSHLSPISLIQLGRTNHFLHNVCKEFLQKTIFQDIGNFTQWKIKYLVLKKSINMHLIKNFDQHNLTFNYSSSFSNRDWSCLSKYVRLSENFLLEHQSKLDWLLVSRYQSLSIGFIKSHLDILDRTQVSSHQVLDEGFIEEYIEWVDWLVIQRKQKLSLAFIERHSQQLNWRLICKYQKLPEHFIRNWQEQIHWRQISKSQRLSESFIKEFEDRLSWRNLVQFQSLSWRFLEENQDRVWNYLTYKQKVKLLSYKFGKRYLKRGNQRRHTMDERDLQREIQRRAGLRETAEEELREERESLELEDHLDGPHDRELVEIDQLLARGADTRIEEQEFGLGGLQMLF